MKNLFITFFIPILFHTCMVAQDSTGSISGRVINEDTREQIANATIWLNKIKVGASDSTGRFFIPGILPGSYQLAVTGQRYINKPPGNIVIKRNVTNIFYVYLKLAPSCGPVLNNVYFESHSFTVRPESLPFLDSLTKILNENDLIRVEIHGHSDTWECKENDTALSYQRAVAVANILTFKGIDSTRISIRAYGGTHALAPNSAHGKKDKEGSALNRHVEFRLKNSNQF